LLPRQHSKVELGLLTDELAYTAVRSKMIHLCAAASNSKPVGKKKTTLLRRTTSSHRIEPIRANAWIHSTG